MFFKNVIDNVTLSAKIIRGKIMKALSKLSEKIIQSNYLVLKLTILVGRKIIQPKQDVEKVVKSLRTNEFYLERKRLFMPLIFVIVFLQADVLWVARRRTTNSSSSRAATRGAGTFYNIIFKEF